MWPSLSGTGVIEFDEFFSFLKEPRSRFQDTMFQFIVREQEDQLDFTRWMRAVFGFCFMTQTELVERELQTCVVKTAANRSFFAEVFQSYDSRRAGALSLVTTGNLLSKSAHCSCFAHSQQDVHNFLRSIHGDNGEAALASHC